jgi:hypothetical protein
MQTVILVSAFTFVRCARTPTVHANLSCSCMEHVSTVGSGAPDALAWLKAPRGILSSRLTRPYFFAWAELAWGSLRH